MAAKRCELCRRVICVGNCPNSRRPARLETKVVEEPKKEPKEEPKEEKKPKAKKAAKKAKK
tara:strand:- start:195 stop:377 length:183 start_codon:yes stop_codon:yes gene_type:complete